MVLHVVPQRCTGSGHSFIVCVAVLHVVVVRATVSHCIGRVGVHLYCIVLRHQWLLQWCILPSKKKNTSIATRCRRVVVGDLDGRTVAARFGSAVRCSGGILSWWLQRRRRLEANENFLKNNQMVVAVLGWSWHWRKLVDRMDAWHRKHRSRHRNTATNATG